MGIENIFEGPKSPDSSQPEEENHKKEEIGEEPDIVTRRTYSRNVQNAYEARGLDPSMDPFAENEKIS